MLSTLKMCAFVKKECAYLYYLWLNKIFISINILNSVLVPLKNFSKQRSFIYFQSTFFVYVFNAIPYVPFKFLNSFLQTYLDYYKNVSHNSLIFFNNKWYNFLKTNCLILVVRSCCFTRQGVASCFPPLWGLFLMRCDNVSPKLVTT